MQQMGVFEFTYSRKCNIHPSWYDIIEIIPYDAYKISSELGLEGTLLLITQY